MEGDKWGPAENSSLGLFPSLSLFYPYPSLLYNTNLTPPGSSDEGWALPLLTLSSTLVPSAPFDFCSLLKSIFDTNSGGPMSFSKRSWHNQRRPRRLLWLLPLSNSLHEPRLDRIRCDIKFNTIFTPFNLYFNRLLVRGCRPWAYRSMSVTMVRTDLTCHTQRPRDPHPGAFSSLCFPQCCLFCWPQQDSLDPQHSL